LRAIQLLVEAKVNLELQDNLEQKTPLQHAVKNNHIAAAKLLIRSKASVHTQDPQGDSALHIAASYGLVDMTIALLKEHAMADLRNKEENTSLHFAAERGHLHVIMELLNGRFFKVDPNAQNIRVYYSIS